MMGLQTKSQELREAKRLIRQEKSLQFRPASQTYSGFVRLLKEEDFVANDFFDQ